MNPAPVLAAALARLAIHSAFEDSTQPRPNGAFGIASDGERLYCTGRGELYEIDKQSAAVTRRDMTWAGDPNHPAADNTLQFSSFKSLGKEILGNAVRGDILGVVDVTTGQFSPLSDAGWDSAALFYDAATSMAYLVEHGLECNIWRFDRGTGSAVRLMSDTVRITASTAMDATHIYFVAVDNPIRDGDPIGIMRVAKPPPPG